ncbi:acetylxylan esterase [Bacteroidota bacterium]
MKKLISISLLICLSVIQVYAQSWRQRMDSLNKISQQDHRLMMEMLDIDELRPGPSGNPDAPNAANTDEALATPYKNLPDPLVFDNGKKVKSAKHWEKRKLEIMEHFDREIYGRVPAKTPQVSWKVVSTKDTMEGQYPVIIKELIGHVDNSEYPAITVDIQLSLMIPVDAAGPVPVIMEFGFNFPASWRRQRPPGPSWQEQLLEKGWGSAKLVPNSIQADNGAGLREGIIGLVNKGEPRKLDDWGSLRAWAWGASRAMDYFESDSDVDEHRVGIEGLSRYGKAAIVTLAYEPRIAIGLIGSSGAGGAKILRRVFGEQVENLASSGEYHWFAPNFIKYAGPLTPKDLPVDAHELLALCAPRPVFISVGSPAVEGQWIDAKGMFLAGVHAGPVYELLGRQSLGVTEFPPQETTLTEGDIAFRQHEGGHTVGPNWPYFIIFAERYFNE